MLICNFLSLNFIVFKDDVLVKKKIDFSVLGGFKKNYDLFEFLISLS